MEAVLWTFLYLLCSLMLCKCPRMQFWIKQERAIGWPQMGTWNSNRQRRVGFGLFLFRVVGNVNKTFSLELARNFIPLGVSF